MPISTARQIAFDVLRRVEAEGAYASDVLHASLSPRVRPEDAALATEISLGVLRWRTLLDLLIESYSRKPAARLDLPVALALRMGLYQIRFLARVPPSAAVNESVELVKRARKSSAATLVNAVLRRAAGEVSRHTAEFLPAEIAGAERLAILHSHPSWLVERWLARFGEARTLALLAANNRAPRLACAVHDPSRFEEVAAELRREKLRVEPGALLKSALASGGGSVSATAAFRRGDISIQDEASQAIPLLLGVRSAGRVLDLCAAPGGKTAAFARAAGPRGFVVAADRYSHRLHAMRAQFERIGLSSVKIIELNGEAPLPFGAVFDRVLVDAPCSGTGTLARHPEIRWRLSADQLADLHRMQVRILANAVAALAPAGRLVYSTCSLEPEENEDVVAEVLRECPGIGAAQAGEAASLLQSHLADGVDPSALVSAAGHFHTFPGEQRTDGFFAAIIERRNP